MKLKLGFTFLLLFAAFVVYFLFYSNNINHSNYTLKLKEESSISSVLDSLEANDVLISRTSYDLASRIIPIQSVPPGLYKIKSGMGNKELIQKLKHGQQDPINFTLSTATFITEIASRAGQKMSFDSTQFMNYVLTDSTIVADGFNSENILCLFLPNTHQIYWTSSVDKFVGKFRKDYDDFWNEDRQLKAKALGLSRNEVYILASMVQKEYTMKDERSRIAGVLINRLHRSMPLQVDATCKYATRDFAAKRVLNFHTGYPSPYNTYLNMGITPGPICVPERSTIDAVLNAEKHNYIFYCADPSLNGYHVFSVTLSEHDAVASRYHQKMNEMKMK